MKEISYCFSLVNPDDIHDKLIKRQPIPKTAIERRFMSNTKIVFSQSSSRGENGLSWSQQFRATCKDASILEFNGLKKHIAIFLADGKVIIVGNALSTPLITVTEYENNFEITTEFSSPEQSSPVSVL